MKGSTTLAVLGIFFIIFDSNIIYAPWLTFGTGFDSGIVYLRTCALPAMEYDILR